MYVYNVHCPLYIVQCTLSILQVYSLRNLTHMWTLDKELKRFAEIFDRKVRKSTPRCAVPVYFFSIKILSQMIRKSGDTLLKSTPHYKRWTYWIR